MNNKNLLNNKNAENSAVSAKIETERTNKEAGANQTPKKVVNYKVIQTKKIKKTALEIKIEELKARQAELKPQLAEAEKNYQQAEKLSEAIKEAENLTYDYWEREKNEAEADEIRRIISRHEAGKQNYIDNSVEWKAKELKECYEKLSDANKFFYKRIVKSANGWKVESLKDKLYETETELQKTERKHQKFLIKKSGRELLPCDDYYNNNKNLGCLNRPDNSCRNCRINYCSPLEILAAEVKKSTKNFYYNLTREPDEYYKNWNQEQQKEELEAVAQAKEKANKAIQFLPNYINLTAEELKDLKNNKLIDFITYDYRNSTSENNDNWEKFKSLVEQSKFYIKLNSSDLTREQKINLIKNQFETNK